MKKREKKNKFNGLSGENDVNCVRKRIRSDVEFYLEMTAPTLLIARAVIAGHVGRKLVCR